MEIEGGKSGGKLGRYKVRRPAKFIHENYRKKLDLKFTTALCSALYHPISLHPPRLIKISNKKHRFSAAVLVKVSHPSNWGKDRSEGKGGKKRCCISPPLNDSLLRSGHRPNQMVKSGCIISWNLAVRSLGFASRWSRPASPARRSLILSDEARTTFGVADSTPCAQAVSKQ